jgi:hypothetical protein
MNSTHGNTLTSVKICKNSFLIFKSRRDDISVELKYSNSIKSRRDVILIVP